MAIFESQVTADYNDSGFKVYSLSLAMKLNVPKCQCSFTLLTPVRIVGGVISRSLSLTSTFEYSITRLRLYKMNLQSFKSATTESSKLVYYGFLEN